MSDLVTFCNKIAKLSELAKEDLLNAQKSKTFKENDIISGADNNCNNYYFIEKGLTKICYYAKGKEFIMTFFREQNMFTDLSSFFKRQPSKYILQALELTETKYLTKTDIDGLCKKHHSFETIFSKLYSFASMKMMDRISEMLEENATARYVNFVKENGDLFQRISLGELAKYLGISQVSLSRIRAKVVF